MHMQGMQCEGGDSSMVAAISHACDTLRSPLHDDCACTSHNQHAARHAPMRASASQQGGSHLSTNASLSACASSRVASCCCSSTATSARSELLRACLRCVGQGGAHGGIAWRHAAAYSTICRVHSPSPPFKSSSALLCAEPGHGNWHTQCAVLQMTLPSALPAVRARPLLLAFMSCTSASLARRSASAAAWRACALWASSRMRSRCSLAAATSCRFTHSVVQGKCVRQTTRRAVRLCCPRRRCPRGLPPILQHLHAPLGQTRP